MSANVQAIVVAVLLLWSLGFMLRRQFPKTTRRLQQYLADACGARGWGMLARYLQPAEKMAAACDSGCSSCSTACAADKAVQAPTQEAPVRWRHPPATGGCH